MERKKLTFYPWDVSVTGSWSPDTGIYLLRDETPEKLAEILWKPGIHVQNTAIMELLAHGNPRKAAEVARALINAHPVVEKSIIEEFGEEMVDFLLKTKLELIPSKPEEYPSDIKVDYIQ